MSTVLFRDRLANSARDKNTVYNTVPSVYWSGEHRSLSCNDGGECTGESRPEIGDTHIARISTNFEEEYDDAENSSHAISAENSPKQSQISATLDWLSDNYERSEGVCLPRCVLYTHYLDFCKKQRFSPAGAATFGKVIRQRFPKLTTRRLGTRGQSKYHYYGIGIKESSIYYHSVYSGKGLTRFSGVKIKTEGSNRKYSLSSKTGTLLPEFPDADNLILPECVEKDKLETFIMMYRTHCQRILDTVIGANFDEVENFLLHFWQGMPEHLVDLLNARLLTDLIALCDSILYKAVIDVLIPNTIQDLPDSLSGEIKGFIRRLPNWLDNALETVPDVLRKVKIEVARCFIGTIRRQISFVHLAQTARSVLLNQDSVSQMIQDLSAVDFPSLCCQAGFTRTTNSSHQIVLKFYNEFQMMLSKQSSVEAYTEWLDNIVDSCVLKTSLDCKHSFKSLAAEFLLQWTVYNSLLMRDLTLLSASSFGSFHLIHMMLDEYMLLAMETQLYLYRERELQRAVQNHMKQAGEINMQPKVRPQLSKPQNSPKAKRRKTEESCESDDGCGSSEMDEFSQRVSNSGILHHTEGTAFSRPVPLNHRQSVDEGERTVIQPNPLVISPVKHMQPSQDRNPYIPPFNVNSYTDYLSPNTSYVGLSSRCLSESLHGSHQGFVPVTFNSNISPGSSYWSGSRQQAPYTDHCTNYHCNKFQPTYDSYSKSSVLRTGPYTESLNRSAFETTRGYYSRDNLQGGSLTVGPYGANFMDIAPPSIQYARQDSVFCPEEVLPNNVGAFTPFNKSFLTASFR